MGIIENILKRAGYLKAEKIGELLGGDNQYIQSYGLSQPENYAKYLTAYENELWVYTCVYTIANAIAGLPYRIVYKLKDSKGNISKKDAAVPEVRALFEKPNHNDENSTWYNLLEFTVGSCELTGNGYWLQDELVGKKPKSLQQLISSRITIVPGKEDYIEKYLYQLPNATDKKPLSPEEVSHFKYVSVNNYFYGQSAFSPTRWSVETLKEAIQTNLNIFKNGAHLDGVLETEQQLNDLIYKRLKMQFVHKHEGTKNAHKTAILEKGLKYKTVVGTMRDLEYIEGTKLNREEICAAFGVPPLIVGILDKSSYSNYRESEKIFWRNTVIPKLHKFEPVINDIVHRFDPKAIFEFDISKIEALKEDEKLKSDIAKTYFSMGISPNEIISKLNLPFDTFKGGEVGYLPLNLVPVGSATTPSEEGKSKTVKMLYTEERKEILWKRYDAMIRKIENLYMKKIDEFFSRQGREVMGRLGKDGGSAFIKEYKVKDDVIDVKAEVKVNIETILFNEKEEIDKWATESVKIHGLALEENGKRELANIVTGLAFDVTNPRIVNWLKKNALSKSTEVNGNLRDELKKQLVTGVEAGESIPELKRRIAEIYLPYKDKGYKATRMARTEVIGASNKGAIEAYKQSGVVEKKAWLSAKIGDLREDHLHMESKTAKGIPVDRDFILPSGATCEAPGQTGIADEDINCRCTVIPVIKEA